MLIRDRIKELRRVKAGSLRPHPKNWRTHPTAQRDALRGVLAEIGYADALIARELSDGTLQLIDGHLRAELTPEQEVPVLVVDLSDEEAAKLLAVHDPLAGMAAANEEMLAELLADVETQSEAVQALLDGLLPADRAYEDGSQDDASPADVKVPELFQIVIQCRDEEHQRELFERFTAEGLQCRLLML